MNKKKTGYLQTIASSPNIRLCTCKPEREANHDSLQGGYVMPSSLQKHRFSSETKDNLLLGNRSSWNFLHFDFDVDARWQVERSKRIDRLRIRIEDIDNSLVDSHLELLSRILVNEGGTIDREFLLFRW